MQLFIFSLHVPLELLNVWVKSLFWHILWVSVYLLVLKESQGNWGWSGKQIGSFRSSCSLLLGFLPSPRLYTVPSVALRGCQILQNYNFRRVWTTQCGCVELNLGPLQEQQVLPTAELSLQTLKNTNVWLINLCGTFFETTKTHAWAIFKHIASIGLNKTR